MADAWGGSWLASWGSSWGYSDTGLTDRGGDGFSSTGSDTKRRKRRRAQSLKRNLAYLESIAASEVETEQAEISQANIDDAIETIEELRPEAAIAAEAVRYVIPDYMALPRELMGNRDALVAAVALWMMREAERRAIEAENEAEEEMILLAMLN